MFIESDTNLTPVIKQMQGSRDSSVGIATGYGLDGQGLIPGRDVSLLHSVQTGSGAHPASYPMGTGGSFPGDKAAGA
jgi:hypothetical protein